MSLDASMEIILDEALRKISELEARVSELTADKDRVISLHEKMADKRPSSYTFDVIRGADGLIKSITMTPMGNVR